MHLARAESEIMNDDGLIHLQEGLAALELVLDERAGVAEVAIGQRLGETYLVRIHARAEQELARNVNVPEQVLRHLFAVLRAFDDLPLAAPAGSRDLKIEVVRRIIDLAYEGFSPAEKARAYEQLAALAGTP